MKTKIKSIRETKDVFTSRGTQHDGKGSRIPGYQNTFTMTRYDYPVQNHSCLSVRRQGSVHIPTCWPQSTYRVAIRAPAEPRRARGTRAADRPWQSHRPGFIRRSLAAARRSRRAPRRPRRFCSRSQWRAGRSCVDSDAAFRHWTRRRHAAGRRRRIRHADGTLNRKRVYPRRPAGRRRDRRGVR